MGAGFLLLLVVWQAGGWWVNQPDLFPSLGKLGERMLLLLVEPTFYSSLGATTLRWLQGLSLSFVLALPVAWLFARFPSVSVLFDPLFSLMRSTPVVSFILIALILMSNEKIPLLIAFLTMFPLLALDLKEGFRQMNPRFKEMGRLFRIGRINHLLHIVYPQLYLSLLTGLLQAGGLGWRAIVMGEVLSQCGEGIGSRMKQAQNYIDMVDLLVWTFVAVLLSILFDRLIRMALRRSLPLFYTASEPQTLPAAELPPCRIVADQLQSRFGVEPFTSVLQSGTIYGMQAPSGRGKTTLLQMMLGLRSADGGRVNVNLDWGAAYVSHETLLVENLTVLDNVSLVLADRFSKMKARQIACQALEMVEMSDLQQRLPAQLSHGQQQRVAIARALVYPSPLLFMDEPFKGLDQQLTHRIIGRIRAEQGKKRQLILFTTHRDDELKALADCYLFMDGRQVQVNNDISLCHENKEQER